VAAVRIWGLGRVIWYQPHTKIMADYVNVQKRLRSFCVVGNFIYLLVHDVEHVLRNVVPFQLVMKGSKNLSHGNRVRHTASKGHGLRNLVKFSITYEMEPGTTYDAERTRIK
jgi:hypothetical protein